MILKQIPSWFVPQQFKSGLNWRTRVLYRLLLGGLLAGVVYYEFQTPWLALSAALVVMATVLVGPKSAVEHYERIQRLSNERKEQNMSDFAYGFDVYVINTWVVRGVYEAFQTYFTELYPDLPAFSIHADDKLEDLLYEIADLEDYLMAQIAQRTGRTLEHYKSNPYYEYMDTVHGLVAFFNIQPKSNLK